MELDYVALSFVRSVADVEDLRQLMAAQGKSIPIISKIEKSEAIENLEAIRDVSDGMMVARGDLGIDMPAQEIPMLQKRIIRSCNEAGIPVITATQMLQSMVEHPRPDASRGQRRGQRHPGWDGCGHAVRRDGQRTLPGRGHPDDASDQHDHRERLSVRNLASTPATGSIIKSPASRRPISAASCAVAEELDVRAIVTSTLSGHTAQQIARHRPIRPVIAVTPAPATQRRLALVWGVECILIDDLYEDTDSMITATAAAVRQTALAPGDKIVITAGIPFGQSGQTNLIKVHEIHD